MTAAQSTALAPNGHPEVVYAAIPGFPGYVVGDDGSVWSCRVRGCSGRLNPGRWTRLSTNWDAAGYLRVNTVREDGRSIPAYVHKLVTLAFLGPRPRGMVIRHLNDVKDDNRLCNLTYGTRKDNARDAVLNGRYRCGELSPTAKLDDRMVATIRRLFVDSQWGMRRIAKSLGLHEATVMKVITGSIWEHVEEYAAETRAFIARVRQLGYHGLNVGANNGRAKLDQGAADEIRARHMAGESVVSLARAFGVDGNTIRPIVKGKTWRANEC